MFGYKSSFPGNSDRLPIPKVSFSMEIVQNILYGFSVCLQPINLLFCFVGATIGTLVGVLPGLGPVAAISLLLPVTFRISSPTSAIIMLAGIYYGAQYGGSTTSILVNIPGEASSVVTCIDGYKWLAREGQDRPRHRRFGIIYCWDLRMIGLMLVAPMLARFAQFGPQNISASCSSASPF
jgi:putative tricarboxylic transport membrane protein